MAKRIAASSINWTAFADIVKPGERNLVLAFKAKTDKFVNAVASQPAELPKIDWSHYKSKIPGSGFVDSFQKNYETVKLTYPSDQGYYNILQAEESEKIKQYSLYKNEINEIIKKLNVALKDLEGIPPYEHMTMEEFILTNPSYGVNIDKPTLWPHQYPDDPLDDKYDDDH